MFPIDTSSATPVQSRRSDAVLGEGNYMPAYLVVVRRRRPEVLTHHPLIVAARSLNLQIDGIAEERRYVLAGDLQAQDLARLAGDLLVDPVLNETAVYPL